MAVAMLLLLLLLSAKALSQRVQIPITGQWAGGFNGEASIPVCKELTGWTIHLEFDTDVDLFEAWIGRVTKIDSRHFIIRNALYNCVQHTGDVLNFSFMGHTSEDVNTTITTFIEECQAASDGSSGGDSQVNPCSWSQVTVPPLSNTGGVLSNKSYEDALGKSILFYNAQRSGKLPADNPIPWRGDSALNDCVVGGWYDAGDHVKFGLPFGSTTLILLWGLHSFKDAYEEADQLDEAYDMIKWATDYMINAWNPATQELVAQIGNGRADHSFWGRAEDMTMDRPCMKLGPGKPGADVAGEWAAALAVAYLVFKDKGDAEYATKCLTAAESMYAFAKANPGTYTKSIQGAGEFYSSSGYKDELCEGASWLYRATNNQQYLEDAKTFHETNIAWAWSWDDKKVACQLLLFEETGDTQYEKEVTKFVTDWMPNSQLAYTPCGLAWRDQWGANRYAATSAFMALLAAEAGIIPAESRKWAVEQINYLLGDNSHDGGCFSYAIGVGSKYPKSPHHRSASCPDIPGPCSAANLHSSEPSPHLLVGALVGGPDQYDNYVDNREDYVMNEVAIDYNSGYQSALAGIIHLKVTDNLPLTNNRCPCAN